MNKKVLVYINLKGKVHKVGTLWMIVQKGVESANFEYANSWLSNTEKLALEPYLELKKKKYQTKHGLPVFASIGDSAPDSWGRLLIEHYEKELADEEKRTRRTLFEVDYLLEVSDFARQGALRYSLEEGGPFLNTPKQHSIPPLTSLEDLLNAAQNIETASENFSDLKLLIDPSTSLGGARAKASVLDNENNLLVAKFPQKDDEWPVIQWEAVALTLAKMSGINVPKWRLEKVKDKFVLLLQRFDRNGTERIPYISAWSMLEGNSNIFPSYIHLLNMIKVYGTNSNKDLEELFRRLIFNILITNSDDHLKNHGFLFKDNVWKLSPVFDINPFPIIDKPRSLCLGIDLISNKLSLEIALSTAEKYNLSSEKANAIVNEVGIAVSQWRDIAKQFEINEEWITKMKSAFEHKELQLACKL